MTARGIYAQTARTYWRRARYLLVLGVAVFLPLGLLESLADRAAELHAENFDSISDFGTIALLGGFLVQAFTSQLGEVFYAGAVALALGGGEESDPPSFGTVARKLAYRRLIAVDLIFAIGSAIGFILLIVPGIVFFTWFALAGPVVELEGAGVRRALARSRRLVRGKFWVVLLVLMPISLGAEAATAGLLQLIHNAIHEPLLSDWAGETIANVLLAPLYAVAAVLITLQRIRGEG